MAKFIVLTHKSDGRKCAINIDNIAEIYEWNDGAVIRYCSGTNEDNLCSIVSETFDEISNRVTNALNWR